MKEIEYDGFITREVDLTHLMKPEKTLEYKERASKGMTEKAKAKPIEECKYPRCEECINYSGGYCTIPIVVSKQIYIEFNDKIDDLMKRVNELENLVMDEILGENNKVRIDHRGYHKQVVCGEEMWCRDGLRIVIHDGCKYYEIDEEYYKDDEEE